MVSARASALVSRAVAWDNHTCLPLRLDDAFLPQLARHRAAGFDVVSVNIGFGEIAPDQHVKLLAHFRRWLKARPDEYLLIRTAQDIARAKETGRLAVCFDIEGADALDGELALVELYYDLGVRWMLFAYNRASQAAGGCQEEDGGLTDFGRALQDEMERVGMVVCCSHTGRRSTMEICERATRPVIFSHSNPSGAWPHDRNIDDTLMAASAATGGVVCINGIGPFLGENDASPQAVVRAIDYAVQRIGPAHVGLGLDYIFDGQELVDYIAAHPDLFPPERGYTTCMSLCGPEGLPGIVEEMLNLGYADADVLAILGGNLLRVAQTAWRD